MRSNSGTVRKNSSDSASLQKPMTRSTPARLYQLRSKRTISPAGGKVRDVALEVPLGALALARSGQRHDAADARIEPLGDPLDHPALARRIAALEDNHDLQPVADHPVLELDQLALKPKQLPEVEVAVERVGPRLLGLVVE